MKRNRDGGNLLTTVVLLVALCGCHALPFTRAAPPSSESSQVHSIIAEIQPQAREAITTYLALQQSRVI
ncbi:MAG: hypothetical protein ICV86_19885, partial [Microcoleus sp. T3-bin5]|nr:hypothetical protein [Microcoleus sp. T3-bin5]